MTFKEQLIEYYHDLTDINLRFFKTFLTLFWNPRKVIENKDREFTTPLKFASIVFSIMFFILFFFIPTEIFEDQVQPAFIQKMELNERNFFENYVVLILAFPFAITFFVWLKVFFFKEESTKFILATALYLTPIIFSMVSLTLALFEVLFSFRANDIIFYLVSLAVPSIYISLLKKEKWLITGLKGVGVSFLTVTMFLLLVGFSNNVFRKSQFKSQSFSNISVNRELPVKEYLAPLMVDVGIKESSVVNSQYQYYLSHYPQLLRIENKTWTRSVKGFDSIKATELKYIRDFIGTTIDSTNVVWVSGMSKDETTYEVWFFVYLDAPQVFSIPIETPITSIATFRVDSTHLEAFLFGKESKKISFYKDSLKTDSLGWEMTSVENLRIDGEGFTRIEKLVESEGYIGSIVSKPSKAVSEMEMVNLDTNFVAKWKTQIYEKQTNYDPLNELKFVINESKKEVITYYSLSNDSSVVIYLEGLDLASGYSIWKKEMAFEADFTTIKTLVVDEKHLYLGGTNVRVFPKHFWQFPVELSYIAIHDRDTGELVKINHFGKTGILFNRSSLNTIYLEKDSVLFSTNDTGVFGFFNSKTGLVTRKVAKKDLIAN